LNSVSAFTTFIPVESTDAQMKLFISDKNDNGWKLWRDADQILNKIPVNEVDAFVGQ
jgi:hypothetical protein